MSLSREALSIKNQEKTEPIKIKTDTEVHDPELVRQQIQNIV